MTLRRRMRPISLDRIQMTDRFWTEWQRVLRETMLGAEWEQIKSTGRLENFLRAGRGETGGHQGFFFNDSDVYKWIEACAFSLQNQADSSVEAMMEEAVSTVAKAQESDGYLNTFFQLMHPELKWRNLNTMHEMYCAGHLVEAAVAHHQATSRRELIDVALRLVDHIMAIFGPGRRRGYCGHQELELALVRIADHLNEPKYAEFAWWMVEERGQQPSIFEAELADEEAMKLSPWAVGQLKKGGLYRGDYAQDHAPIRQHTEVVGHAVRAMYFYAAAVELADAERGLVQASDEALPTALESVWSNLTQRRMYLTGGIGPSAKNEGFTGDYDLPNASAYAETCAAIGLAIWGRRFLEQTGISDFADIIERAIYNGAISGVSLSGDRFFYTNPLESRGDHSRTPWFDCACCPPNIARLIGSIGAYVASESQRDFYLHIPAGFHAQVEFGGVPISLSVESDYPWSGIVNVRVTPKEPVEFGLHVRIPEWCDELTAELDGAQEGDYENGYAVFRRTWKPGDVLTLDFGMSPLWLEANPRVLDDLGRVALTRGPLVYCLESPELDIPQTFRADLDVEVVEAKEDLLGGVTTITVEGVCELSDFPDALYATAGSVELSQGTAKFIPYYGWNNRGASHMQVWVRRA